ncbi:MAG: hypothetical protein PHE53_03565 [Thermoguttaceae bacterium]|nr:hypothetical protein [Thermoguttaceae bacterium]
MCEHTLDAGAAASVGRLQWSADDGRLASGNPCREPTPGTKSLRRRTISNRAVVRIGLRRCCGAAIAG